MERRLAEHMQMVADMDFLVIMVRRLLRTAELARGIPSVHQSKLKQAIKVFNSKSGKLEAIRNALEHADKAAMLPLPAVGIPMSGHGDGHFIFMWPGGNLDIGKLFEDAQTVFKAILRVIEPLEAERDAQA